MVLSYLPLSDFQERYREEERLVIPHQLTYARRWSLRYGSDLIGPDDEDNYLKSAGISFGEMGFGSETYFPLYQCLRSAILQCDVRFTEFICEQTCGDVLEDDLLQLAIEVGNVELLYKLFQYRLIPTQRRVERFPSIDLFNVFIAYDHTNDIVYSLYRDWPLKECKEFELTDVKVIEKISGLLASGERRKISMAKKLMKEELEGEVVTDWRHLCLLLTFTDDVNFFSQSLFLLEQHVRDYKALMSTILQSVVWVGAIEIFDWLIEERGKESLSCCNLDGYQGRETLELHRTWYHLLCVDSLPIILKKLKYLNPKWFLDGDTYLITLLRVIDGSIHADEINEKHLQSLPLRELAYQHGHVDLLLSLLEFVHEPMSCTNENSWDLCHLFMQHQYSLAHLHLNNVDHLSMKNWESIICYMTETNSGMYSYVSHPEWWKLITSKIAKRKCYTLPCWRSEMPHLRLEMIRQHAYAYFHDDKKGGKRYYGIIRNS